MDRVRWERVGRVLGTCVLVLFGGLVLTTLITIIYINAQNAHTVADVKREGMAARFNNVSAAANPYADESSIYRHAWYDGWMEIERLKK